MNRDRILYNFLLNFIKSEFIESRRYTSCSISCKCWTHRGNLASQMEKYGDDVRTSDELIREVGKYFPFISYWEIHKSIKVLLDDKML